MKSTPPSIVRRLAAVLCVSALLLPLAAAADTPSAPPASSGSCPTGYTCLTNPLGPGSTNVPVIVGNVIKAGMGIIGAIALLVFVYGGFMWLTSGGSSKRIEAGRNAMIWAAIGIIIVLSSYALVSFVFKSLTTR